MVCKCLLCLRDKTLQGSLLLGCMLSLSITTFLGGSGNCRQQDAGYCPPLCTKGTRDSQKAELHRNGKAKGKFKMIQLKLQVDMLWALFGTTTDCRLFSASEQNTTSMNQVTGMAETLLPRSMSTSAGFSATFCGCYWRMQP